MGDIHVRPVRDLRNNYSEIEALLEDRSSVLITKNGRSAAVLISPEDFKDYQNYLHVKYVAEKLKEAEDEESGGVWLDADEVFSDMLAKYVKL